MAAASSLSRGPRRWLIAEIDRHMVYRILKDDLGDFDRFIRAVSKLL